MVQAISSGHCQISVNHVCFFFAINMTANISFKGYNRIGKLIVIVITALSCAGDFNVMRSQITARFILAAEPRSGLSMAR